MRLKRVGASRSMLLRRFFPIEIFRCKVADDRESVFCGFSFTIFIDDLIYLTKSIGGDIGIACSED